MTGDFECEAYGPEGREFGALCFTAGQGERACRSPGECHAVMDAERKRVFRAISENAAAGDPVAAYLAGEFASPDELLGGPDGRGD